MLAHHKPDVAVLQETHRFAGSRWSALTTAIQGYKPIFAQAPHESGARAKGGTLVLVSTKLAADDQYGKVKVEHDFVILRLPRMLRLIAVYLPPNASQAEYGARVQMLYDEVQPGTVIVGDMNMAPGSPNARRYWSPLLEDHFGIHRVDVGQPTCYQVNSHGGVNSTSPDVVLSNYQDVIAVQVDVTHTATAPSDIGDQSRSDHACIVIQFSRPVRRKGTGSVNNVRLFDKPPGDPVYGQFNGHVSTVTQNALLQGDVPQAWHVWQMQAQEFSMLARPCKAMTLRNVLTVEESDRMSCLFAQLAWCQRHPGNQTIPLGRSIKRQLMYISQEAERRHQHMMMGMVKPTQFSAKAAYDLLWSRCGMRPDNPEPVISDTDFAEHFASIVRQPGRRRLPFPSVPSNVQATELFNIDDVARAASRLKLNKATGVDGIDGCYIKYLDFDTPSPNAQAVTAMVTQCLNTLTFPGVRFVSKVTALPKTDTPSTDPSQYRGLANPSILEKVMGNMLEARLRQFAESNGLLSNVQHGFREGKGTQDTAVCLSTLLRMRQHAGMCTFVAQLDVRKAYDSVHHETLIQVLRHKGFPELLCRQVQFMLANTVYKVGRKVVTPNSGVPQGSPMSPILFAIYINHVSEVMCRRFHRDPSVIWIVDQDAQGYSHAIPVHHVVYADDIVLLAQDWDQIHDMIDCAESALRDLHLQLNRAKTKISHVAGKGAQSCTGSQVAENQPFKVLGTWFGNTYPDFYKKHDDTVLARVRTAFAKLVKANAFNDEFTLADLRKIIRATVLGAVEFDLAAMGVPPGSLRIQRLVNKIMRCLGRVPRSTRTVGLQGDLKWESVEQRLARQQLLMYAHFVWDTFLGVDRLPSVVLRWAMRIRAQFEVQYPQQVGMAVRGALPAVLTDKRAWWNTMHNQCTWVGHTFESLETMIKNQPLGAAKSPRRIVSELMDQAVQRYWWRKSSPFVRSHMQLWGSQPFWQVKLHGLRMRMRNDRWTNSPNVACPRCGLEADTVAHALLRCPQFDQIRRSTYDRITAKVSQEYASQAASIMWGIHANPLGWILGSRTFNGPDVKQKVWFQAQVDVAQCCNPLLVVIDRHCEDNRRQSRWGLNSNGGPPPPPGLMPSAGSASSNRWNIVSLSGVSQRVRRRLGGGQTNRSYNVPRQQLLITNGGS